MYDNAKMYIACRSGDHKAIAQFLKLDPEHKAVNKGMLYNCSPLFHTVCRDDFYAYSPGHYLCMILLLEAGANAFQYQVENAKYKNLSTPFYVALENHNLAAMRLMLWYNPDYENIDIIPKGLSFRAVERAKYIDRSKYPGFAKYIADTASEARRMRQHTAHAAQWMAQHHYPNAVYEFEQAALIYAAQARLEVDIPYYPHARYYAEIPDAPSEAYRPILINYYHQKQYECLGQAYQCYQLIHENLTKAPALTAPFRQYHIEVLDRFLTLHRILKEGVERVLAFYQSLKIAAPEIIQALNKTIKENDPKFLPLLTQLAGLRSEMDASALTTTSALIAPEGIMDFMPRAITEAGAADITFDDDDEDATLLAGVESPRRGSGGSSGSDNSTASAGSGGSTSTFWNLMEGFTNPLAVTSDEAAKKDV